MSPPIAPPRLEAPPPRNPPAAEDTRRPPRSAAPPSGPTAPTAPIGPRDSVVTAPGNVFTQPTLLQPLAAFALPPSAPPPPGLTIGAQGAKVAKAERMLRRAGFDPGARDATFGEKTEKALKKFQASVGLPPTGRLDDRTMGRLQQVDRRIEKHDGARIGAGQQSEGIEKIERRLRKLGYDTGRVDGVYDRETAGAVRAFKRDQDELKSGSGTLGREARRSLKRESDAVAHDPFHARKHVDSGRERRHLQRLDERVAEAASRTNAFGQEGFGTGSRGKAVEYVQQHLRAAGFPPKRFDGVFDERTAGALRNYQRREGIPQTGRVDETTWNHLKKATLEANGVADPKQTIGERSGAVKRTEKMLDRLGFDPGKVDGRYTEGTEKAIDRFRRRHDMDPQDGVGTNAFQALKKAVKNQSPFGKPQTVRAYDDGRGYNIKVVRVDGKYVVGEPELVRADMAKAFKKMYDAAQRDGVDLRIVDGFRTMGEQQHLYNLYLSGQGNPANPPGYSEHQNGRALDFNVQTNGNDAVGVGSVYNWLARNGGRFGFQRIPSEAWHWEFRG